MLPTSNLSVSKAEDLRRRFAAHLRCAPYDPFMPEHSDLTPFCPPREDQGRTSTCYAHAISVGIAAALSGAGVPSPVVPSPRIIAALSERREQRGPLRDCGVRLATALDVVREIGIAPMHSPTPDGRCSDVTSDGDYPGQANDELDATERDLAECRKIPFDFGRTSIDLGSREVFDHLVTALCTPPVAPILIGAMVGMKFARAVPGQVLEGDDDEDEGGHALLIIGHRTDVYCKREFLLVNSWGTSWDESGEAWASEAWILGHVFEAHPLTMRPPLGVIGRLMATLRSEL